jgi:hypothetical protein
MQSTLLLELGSQENLNVLAAITSHRRVDPHSSGKLDRINRPRSSILPLSLPKQHNCAVMVAILLPF